MPRKPTSPQTQIDDRLEAKLLADYEAGALASVATRGELARLKAAARATALKDRRVDIRLSTGDLQDLQVKAMEEGLPCQTLIASVLHKYVSGRLVEAPPAASSRGRRAGGGKG